MPEPLSPAAQAVPDAVEDHGKFVYRNLAAGALRAAALYCTRESASVLMNLAAELEGADGEVPRIGHILRLAEIIREVDGKHDKGAAALAEAILSHPGIRSAGLTAALAEPVAEGPTDEELYELWEREGYEGDFQDCRRFYRGAIARWGRPAAAPVPVSERLPSAADCDVADNCWWFDPHADGAWYVDTFLSCYTHWLPAHALPTPEVTND